MLTYRATQLLKAVLMTLCVLRITLESANFSFFSFTMNVHKMEWIDTENLDNFYFFRGVVSSDLRLQEKLCYSFDV